MPQSSVRVGSAVSLEALGPWAGGPRGSIRIPLVSSAREGEASVQSAVQPEDSGASSSTVPFCPAPGLHVPSQAASVETEGLFVQAPSSHDWQWRPGSRRFVCTKCLSFKRVLEAPDQHVCAGFHRKLHVLCADPDQLGHSLYLFTYSAEEKFLVVCRKCGSLFDGGGLQGLGRTCSKPNGGFTSPQTKSNWDRASSGRHPRAAKYGEAKVLDPRIALTQALQAYQLGQI